MGTTELKLMDYSISLNGILAAQRCLAQSARRIATPQPATDYAAEFIAVDQAKIAEKANLRVLSAGNDLEVSLLDLFG
jgi:hypothetical protein